MPDTHGNAGHRFGDTAGLFDDWLTHADLARALGVSGTTLHRWATAGSAPPRVKVGGRVLYRKAAVLEWLRNRERP